MKSKTTWYLFFGAIGLFVFIYFVESNEKRNGIAATRATLFSGISARDVRAVEYRISNQVVRAERTNDTWRLTSPFYPAQVTPIESFIANFTELPRLEVINPSEVTGKLKEFGLEPPAAIVSLTAGSNRHQLQIGGRTPFADNVYVQMAGSAQVIVTDGKVLKALPPSADPWRSPMLAHLSGRPFDGLQIRSRGRFLEFDRDPTNQVWRISRPAPARADNHRIVQLLQLLTTAQVQQFVTDFPVIDLDRFGLQPPVLELSLSLDTNRVTAFEFGSSPTNNSSVVYVRRLSHTNIVTVGKELLEALNQPAKSFHDPWLLSIDSNLVSQIRVNGTNGFTVIKVTNGVWRVTEPAPMATDPDAMRFFLGTLQGMQIVDFAKDVPSDADLQQFGLAPPAMTVSLFGIRTNAAGILTNTLLTEVAFGSNKVDVVHARRSDEIPVYITTYADVVMLPKFAWQLRDRRVFEFAPTNVTAIASVINGTTSGGARNPGGWIEGDEVRNGIIEEALFRIGAMFTRRWVSKTRAELGNYGISDASPRFDIGVAHDGNAANQTAIRIWFGKRAFRNNIYAATILPDETEPTVFEFPGDIYDLLVRAGLVPAP